MRVQRVPGPTVERSSTVTPASGAGASAPTSGNQKFCGSPRWRRAMMFFWISDEPPPTVSFTVAR